MCVKEQTCYELLEEIILKEAITTLYQPIVCLEDCSVIGYEALSRGPKDTLLEMPDNLFKAADEYDKLWEIEYLCRKKALEKAAVENISKLLFINVDPKIIHNDKFRQGFTKEYINLFNLNPENIIFEITEKTCIEDYEVFKNIIENYKMQGYKIALDDTGEGYSGLRMLAETCPKYIKIDKELIKNINDKKINRSLVTGLVEFAKLENMHIIAEGIETYEELKTVIALGVKYGQGYFLQRPKDKISEINEEVVNSIREINNEIYSRSIDNFSKLSIGKLVKNNFFVPQDVSNKIIDALFRDDEEIHGIPVVNENKVKGLVMRNNFYARLSTTYGNAIYMNRNVSLLMETNPMIVDYSDSVTKVSNEALKRNNKSIYDSIIVCKNDEYYGIITIKELLEYTTDINVQMARSCNPLTGLPGNRIIDSKLEEAIQDREKLCAVYFDLDNFKGYNDLYGFENGDRVIMMTAEILLNNISCCNEQGFLGHVGGDDFVAIINQDSAEEILENVIYNFDSKIKNYFSKEDVERGYFISHNRKGEEDVFPLVSISIAALNLTDFKFGSTYELSQKLGLLKKKCKEKIGSNILFY
ncbi:EAL domain-containing protein [Clostridium sp. 19966]|uniref:EAL domain-containing protein n=1 Tax=Clostridium sp. 19966 TaxID=2768166 RepID=UPI0028DF4D70|nr:EAL domain-containing protein [Clostridium sp. 19966]MDT8715501.1 EAL domain-containing protein [Clostridium sp. 19966]